MRSTLLMLGLLFASATAAHPLAPALLALHETAAEHYEVLWRSSVVRVRGTELAPRWPAHCSAERRSGAVAEDEAAWVEHWALRCPGGLVGAVIGVDGLERAGVNVILRIQPQHGAPQQALLDANRSHFLVPEVNAAPSVFLHYLLLGVEHLVLGPDHLLFVLGLLLLVRGWRRLFWTITAFTLGHSLTLSLAALGLVRVHPMLTELAIAISILWLAAAILRQREAPPHRLPGRLWIMALLFGLLHGLGFAGALAQTGLPPDEIPQALLAFNLGIELGQLAVVAAALGLTWMLQRADSLAASRLAARTAAAYVIGTMAAYWCWDRAAVLWM